MNHKAACRCVFCLLKAGEQCPKSTCIASAGHAGDCVPVWQAPRLLAKLMAIGVARKLGMPDE